MIDTDEEDTRLRRADCASLLQISRHEVWWRNKTGEFALPAGTDEHGPYWHPEELFSWAAATGVRRLVHAVPLRTWPDATAPAGYVGATSLQGCVVQVWAARPTGTIGVVWRLPERWMDEADELFEELAHVDVLVRVQPDFGLDGPGLSTTQRRGPTAGEWDDFGMRWQDLARVLGQPAPYWPYTLRISRLITDWRPGATTVTYPTIPEVDTTPLLRLAATMPPQTPAYQALMHLVTVAQHRSTSLDAKNDLEILAETLVQVNPRDWPPEKTTAVAALPLPVPEPVDDDRLDLATIRAGWMDVLERTDQLAADCVREAAKWDGGKYFPHASVEEVDPTGEFGAEWAARLEPVAHRKAIHWRLQDDGEAFVDPESDAPVVRRPNGNFAVAVPQRLPTTEPLAEVILDRPIWIRTADGTLHPAPRGHYYGLSWGYGGSGPGALALLIHRLLEDITAPGTDRPIGAPDGLKELTRLPWRRGTVLTREVLEAARDGRPYDKPSEPRED